LEPLGRAGQPPTPPINVLADFAGGGMLLAFGVACAAFERAASGKGQVVDAAMVDGAALMLTPFYAARASGFWGPRGTNFLDTGFAPALAPTEAPDHPHNRARHTFLRIDGVPQPAPAPRFSRTPATVGRPPTHSGDDDDEALAAWGFTPAEIDELRAADAIA